MEIADFSNGFDTLVSSYSLRGGFGDTQPDLRFDEYEKSLFLTQAQEEIVVELYSGKNPYGDSFESSEEMRRYLSPLVAEASLMPVQNSGGVLGVDSSSKFFTLPEDLWFITYESADVRYGADGPCGENGVLDVYPVTQDEYHKVKRNPFRGANDRRVLRLDLADGVVELVGKYEISKYYVRYLRNLHPIILINLGNEGSIRGERQMRGCELHEALHQKILDRAVLLALRSKGAVPQQNERK